MDDCRDMQEMLTDNTQIEQEIQELNDEYSVVCEMLHKMIENNSRNAQDQDVFLEKFKGLEDRLTNTERRIRELKELRQERLVKADLIGAFMFELYERGQVIEEFDTRLWLMTVSTVTVQQSGALFFNFRNGMSIEVKNE